MTYEYRVLYADTDLAGVVYHGQYVRLFEAARTELMAAVGCAPAEIQREAGIVFTVTAVELAYHAPAEYGDLLQVDVRPLKMGPARLGLGYDVRRNGAAAVCVSGSTTIAALDLERRRVVRLPERLMTALAALWEGGDDAG